MHTVYIILLMPENRYVSSAVGWGTD